LLRSSNGTVPASTTLQLTALSIALALLGCGPRFSSRDDGAAGSGGAGGSNVAGTTGSGVAGERGGQPPVKPSGGGTSAEAGSSPIASSGGGNTTTGTGGNTTSGGNTTTGTGGNTTSGGGNTTSGGGNTTGGHGGAFTNGGSGAAGGALHCQPATLIDDMEDGDDRNCPNQQRNGEWWSATGTTTGTIEPPTHGNFPAYALGSDARGESHFGMRLSGTGFGHTDDDWASLGFNLIDDAAYDLSGYAGLAFYAKSKRGNLPLHVEFATNTTTALAEGGACSTNCNDHYATKVTLDGTWREYSVPLGQLQQEGWGPKDKDLAHTRFVYFGFLGTDGGAADFEFLIDDVRLF
jgi:hypothetical protein